MKRIGVLLAALILAGPTRILAQDSDSPHRSTEMCSVCHNEDMSLQRSKLETCTLCHAQTVHSGAAEHLAVDPARIATALSGKTSNKVTLPLTEDGHMWCGTCHLFHDPSLGEDWLPAGWIPPDTGLPEAVRAGVTARWTDITKSHAQAKVEAHFAAKGTRALRLPVNDGSLCMRCHGSLP
jgi:hypothetical protein